MEGIESPAQGDKRKTEEDDDQGWLNLANKLKARRIKEPSGLEEDPVMDTSGDIDMMTRHLLMIGLDTEEVQWIMAGSKKPDRSKYDLVRQYCDHDTRVQRHKDHVQNNENDTSMLDRIQQSPGLVLDISAVSSTGVKWDFTKEGNRQEASELVDSKVALIVIASPIKQLRYMMVKTQYDTAIRHVEKCAELCKRQDELGMLFMFE